VYLTALVRRGSKREKEENRLAVKYFSAVESGVYEAVTSFTALAETFYIIMSESQEKYWTGLIENILLTVKRSGVEITSVKIDDVLEIRKEIPRIEDKCGPMDATLISEAIHLKNTHTTPIYFCFATLGKDMGTRVNSKVTAKKLLDIKQITQKTFKKRG